MPPSDSIHYFILDGLPGKMRFSGDAVIEATIVNLNHETIAVTSHEVRRCATMITYQQYQQLLHDIREKHKGS